MAVDSGRQRRGPNRRTSVIARDFETHLATRAVSGFTEPPAVRKAVARGTDSGQTAAVPLANPGRTIFR